MSQIEQRFRQFISKSPEIGKCYQEGLINRRSLARYLIKEGIARPNQMEATIAMLRRYQFRKFKKQGIDFFKDIKVNIRDRILILEFEKEKELMKRLQQVIAQTNYDKGDTLKIVIGTAAIKIFIDKENEKAVRDIFGNFKIKKRFDNISELSIIFSEKATDAKGILSTIASELTVNDISLNELLTGAPELLVYLKESNVIKAYEIIKALSNPQ
ncbi:hypothetical protein GF323_06450 [Candidatus Woesearchaeota archaeon]|nr:hypothetical protein [Candidatus Woesearchaeota archaeon]